MPRGGGKTIVITGGNRGLGFEAIKHFLALGYNVIIGCRKTSELASSLGDLKNQGNLGTGHYEILDLDLMSLDSVRAFAQKVLDKNIPINVLLNNAGIKYGPHKKTKDGFESQMGVNHLSHFLLTHLLMPRLREAGTKDRMARVVNTTSFAHKYGTWMDFEDVHCRNHYSSKGCFGNSKAAQVMFTYYLNKVIVAQRAKIRVSCFHPGYGRSDKQASDSLIHAAIAPELEGQGGLYLENLRPAEPSAFVRKVDNQKKMWNVSCALTGIDVGEYGGFT